MEDEQQGVTIEPPATNMPQSFLNFLAAQENGNVVGELSTSLRDLTEAIENHFDRFRGKVSGQIDLKIKLTLEGGAYKVLTEYTVKPPKAPANAPHMWLGADGSLINRDPRQLSMPFGQPRAAT